MGVKKGGKKKWGKKKVGVKKTGGKKNYVICWSVKKSRGGEGHLIQNYPVTDSDL